MELKSCHWLALALLPMVVVAMARGESQEDSAPAVEEGSGPEVKFEGYYGDRDHKVRSCCLGSVQGWSYLGNSHYLQPAFRTDPLGWP